MTAFLLLAAISAAIIVQVAIAIGGAFWRLRHREVALLTTSNFDVATNNAGAWSGWREFRIVSSSFEDNSRSQRSLILAPTDGLALPDFVPGQYLTFSIDPTTSPTEPKQPIMRCYSLSDQPNAESYRITVKRMSAPSSQLDLPAGTASGYIHDRVRVGDILKVKAPAGKFVLDMTSDTPAVLIAGGIGVTPMISMTSWSLAHQPKRRLHLFYGVRNSDDHAFKTLLEGFAKSHPAFGLDIFYSAPGQDDLEGRDFQHTGFIDVVLLKRVLPQEPHVFYVCGPPAMMAALVPALAGLGIPKCDIHFESFGPASSGFVRPITNAVGSRLSVPLDIQFRKSRRTVAWTGEDASLLDFAERHGIAVDSGCRTGSCGTCETQLASGEVRYDSKPDFEMRLGTCLLCVGSPVSNLVLEA